MAELTSVINHSAMITIFVFVMMLIVDYINVLTKGDMEKALKGGRSRQYAIASFLGATPGCLGAFANVSFSFHHLWTSILGFRRFCQGKYDIDISDLRTCGNNT